MRAARNDALVGPSLLEREGELAQFGGLLEAVAAGTGRLVVVEGAPGVGKSALLAALCGEAERAGFLALRARGSELEAEFSFGVVRQLFERTLVDLGTRCSDAAAPAVALFEAAPQPTRPGDREPVFRALQTFYWLAADLAAACPLLLEIDDLHWADDPSLRWLGFLARRLESSPVLVACALRPQEPAADRRPVLSELIADPRAFVVNPQPLSVTAVGSVVRARLDPDADEEFCAACHEVTGGNPLFLGHLLRELSQQGVPARAAEVERVRRSAPASVLRAVELRLGRLAAETMTFAQAVALLGDGVDFAHAAALSRLDPESARDHLRSLSKAEVLHVDDALSVSFVHPIVRTAIYGGISPVDREEGHVRAADVLRSSDAPVERIAAQLLLTQPVGDPRTVAVLREAAQRAMAQGAPETAVRALSRALGEPPEETAHGLVLYELGVAECSVATPAAIDHLRQAIVCLEEPAARGRAAQALAEAIYFAGEQASLAPLLVEEIARLPSDQSDLAQRLEAMLLAIAIEDPELYPLALERLPRLRAQAPDGTVGSRMLLAVLAYHDNRAGTSREDVLERARLALAGESLVRDEGWLAIEAGIALIGCESLDEATALADRVIADARHDVSGARFTLGSLFRGAVALERGELIEAEADLRQAVDAAEANGLFAGMPTAHALLADVQLERGNADGARRTLAHVTGRVPSTIHVTRVRASRGRLLIAQGRLAEGVDELRAVGLHFESLGGDNPASFDWRSPVIPALLGLGEVDESKRLVDDLLERARRWGAPSTLGRAHRLAGVVHGGDRGLESLSEAVSVLSTAASRLEQAKAATELGAALRRSNRRAEARDHLRRGLELSHQSGAQLLEERAHIELVATGARPRRLALSGVDALTPSERRVAGMAAGGMTNRAIAQALFVTPRTVEVHLSAVYRKLEIRSRSQLPAELRPFDGAFASD